MTYAEFVQHIAYHGLFPWGDDWAQARALSASMISASPKFNRINLAPFFPKPRKPAPQSADYIFGVVKQLAIDAEARRKAKSGGTEHQ